MAKRFQQGDVIIKSIAKLPEGAVERTGPRAATVAEGEATGHHHTFRGEELRFFDHGGKIYVSAPKGGVIEHQEHGPITVPPGTYETYKVKEYDHFQEEARQVMD